MVPVLTNKTDLSHIDISSGFVVLISKPVDWTSFDLVKKIRGFLKVRKVGHGGTLDPFATGLMLIGVGKGTKALTALSGLEKSYRAMIRFGEATDSYDRTGRSTEVIDPSGLEIDQIRQEVAQLKGEILQVPPMYSAKKVNGVRLYKLARKDREVHREPQLVSIYKANILSWDSPDLELDLTVSKGTYIRSLAHGLGKALAVPAHLKELQRTQAGIYRLEDSFTIDAFFNFYSEYYESSSGTK